METPNVPTSAPAANAPKPDTNSPANAPKPDANVAAAVQKFKIKDREYTEAELLQRFEKADGADRKFQEAAQQRRQVENVLKALKTNPGKVLLNKALGHNPAAVIKEIVKEAAEAGIDMKELKQSLSEVMYEWIKEEQLDPKDREIRDLKRKMEREENEKKAAKQAEDERILKELTSKSYKTLDDDITNTLKTSGLPKSTFTVKRVAYYLDQAFKLKQEYEARGIQVRDPKASDVIALVRKDYDTMFRDLYQSADVETLINLIGDENVNKIRAYDVNKFKQGQLPGKQPPAAPKAPEHKEEPKKGESFLQRREREIREMERKERGV